MIFVLLYYTDPHKVLPPHPPSASKYISSQEDVQASLGVLGSKSYRPDGVRN